MKRYFAPVSAGAPRRAPHRPDSAAPLGPATCACRSARWLWRAARGLADAARTSWPAFLPAFSSLKYVLDHCIYVQYIGCYVLSPSSPRCCPEGTRMAPAVATYEPRDPSRTVLYTVIADHLETFLASCEADPDAPGLPAYVQREFDAYLQCGILAHGFLRLGCDTCPKELLLPFSCKRRGFCPSCAARRMAQTAAHLVTRVMPWVPTRQWVVSVPVPLRYWMAASQDLTAQVHTIIRTTIGQYYVHQAVTRGVPRDQVQPGSVTFIQRCGSAINVMMSS